MLRPTSLLIPTILSVLATFGYGAEPWETPFTGDNSKVLAAAKVIQGPEGADVVVLLDEQRYTIDSAGRITTSLRKVYRIVTADGVEEWSSISREYAPWHEQKPELRARVITADGSTHSLDPKTITDSPALEFDSSIFSDRRVLRVPLPAVAQGAVVEYEIITKETAPVLDAGSLRRIDIWDFIKIQRFHLIVDAPAGIALKASSQLIPSDKIQRTESKAGFHIECDWGPIEAKKEWESSMPFDVAQHPVFEFSTGRSWQEVAARYGAIVDARIGSATLKAFAEPPKPGESATAIVARLVSALHKQVRYTGMELGDAAIVPSPPADVLARRYGDCKDKATLLVAALRAAGLKAQVALLSTGYGLDVNPGLPGFGLFDHAIVYVDAPDRLWIDATAQYVRVGGLPTQDQGRLALIATATTTALVKTPESGSADNRSLHTIEIRLPEYGRAEIHESIESFGSAESEMRSQYGGAESAKVKDSLERHAKQIFLAEGLGDFASTPGDDFSQPFRVSMTAKNAARGSTEEDQAIAGVFTHFVFNNLPFEIVPVAGEAKSSEEKKPRTHDFVIPASYQAEYRYHVFYPSFLRPKTLPKEEQLHMGPAIFRSTYRQDSSGYIEAVFHFDTVKRRFTPTEYAELRQGLRRVWNEKPDVISFSSSTSEALALGKTAEAVRLAWAYVASHPESAAAQARLARVLIAAGAGDSAVAAAKKAVEMDAKSTQAWQSLAWTYQHDSFGRRFRGNWNPAEAEKAYRKAIEAATDNLVPQIDLAIVFEHNPAGERYGSGSRLNDAVDLYRSILSKAPNAVVRQNLVFALVYAGKYDEAAAEIKKLPASSLQSSLLILVTGLTSGAERAILDAQDGIPDPTARSGGFVNAAITLGKLREYQLATEFLKAARRISDSPEIQNRLGIVSKMKRSDEIHYEPDDPRAVVRRFYLAAFTGNTDMAHLRPLLSKRENFNSTDDSKDIMFRRILAGVKGRFRNLGLSGDTLADVIMNILELEKEGDDALGYRISGKIGPNVMPAAYVIKEDGQYRLLATSDSPENVGRLVLDLLRSRDLRSAQQWLDLVINGAFTRGGETTTPVSLTPMSAGPAGDDSPAARFLWAGFGKNGHNADAIRVTAASLVATYSSSAEEAIAILKQEKHAATNKLDRGNIDLALCQGYAKAGKWNELLDAAKDLSASFAVAQKSFTYLVKARTGLKQWTELELDARTELKTHPQDSEALKAAASAMLRAGKPERATEFVDQIRKLEFAGKQEHIVTAWHALLSGKVDDNPIEQLEHDGLPGNMEPDMNYLVGLLQAKADKADDARRSLTSALDLDDWAFLDARPWVLQGIIQEKFGNNDAAMTAYGEAKKKIGSSYESEWAVKLIPATIKP